MKTSLSFPGVILISMLTCESADLPAAKFTSSVCVFTAMRSNSCTGKIAASPAPAKPHSDPTGKKPKRDPRPARPEYLFL